LGFGLWLWYASRMWADFAGKPNVRSEIAELHFQCNWLTRCRAHTGKMTKKAAKSDIGLLESGGWEKNGRNRMRCSVFWESEKANKNYLAGAGLFWGVR